MLVAGLPRNVAMDGGNLAPPSAPCRSQEIPGPPKKLSFYRFLGVQDMYFGDLKRCKLSPIHRRQTPGDCSGLLEPVETGLTVGFRVKL